MSGWGTYWYEDDYTSDIRDFYMDQLYDGKSHIEAQQAALEEFKPGPDDADFHLFWGTIALLQWERGHLTDEVKDVALELLRSDRDKDYWSDSDPRDQNRRGKILQKCMEKLERPQGKPKRTMPPRGYKCPFQPGDLVCVRLTTLSKENLSPDELDTSCFHNMYCLAYIACVDLLPSWRKGVMDEIPTYGLYDWVGLEKPTVSVAQERPLIQIPYYCGETDVLFRYAGDICRGDKEWFGLEKIGHIDTPPAEMEHFESKRIKKQGAWGDIPRMIGVNLYRAGQRGPTQ